MLIFTGYASNLTGVWITDGTTAGTKGVKSLLGLASYTPLGDGRVVFAAQATGERQGLWITDGTADGTRLLKATEGYPYFGEGPANIAPIGDGRAVYTLYPFGAEWITDGTVAGTRPFFPSNPVAASTLNAPGFFGLTPLGDGRYVFTDAKEGLAAFAFAKLWVTDGTAAGTMKIDALGPTKSGPTGMTMLGDGRVVFAVDAADGSEPWVTDGTVVGTYELRDINPGTYGSSPSGFSAMGGGRAGFVTSTDGALGNFGYWVTDGSREGTVQIYSAPFSTTYNGYNAYARNGIFGMGDGRALLSANFTGVGLNSELGITDGTAAGTRLIMDINPGGNGSNPGQFTALGDGRFVFTADDGTHGYEPWVTDGTAAGTMLLRDIAEGIRQSNASQFIQLGDGRLVFSAWNDQLGQEPWITDGTPAGTMLLKDINDAPSSYYRNFFHGSSYETFGPSGPSGITNFNVAGFALNGDAAANRFKGQDGPDALLGAGGDDVLVQSRGNDLFDGGTGFDRLDDTAVGMREVSLRRDGTDQLLIHGGETDRLRQIEEIDFADGRLVFDATDPAAQVTRLYQAALARLPDQVGLNGWIAQLQSGGPLTDIARGFFASAEFTNRFGAGLSNGQYIDQLYQNVLGRAGEAAGRQGWVDFLGRGASREEVLVGFSESPENRGLTQPLVDAGIWDLSENAGRVARLYDAIMGRLPDVSGMNTWRAALDGGTSLVDVTRGFTGSAEFATRYGNPNNATFVTLLYRNTLEREPDAGGLAYWTGELDRGVSRAEVIIGFSESAEEIALTKGAIMNEAPGSFGILFA